MSSFDQNRFPPIEGVEPYCEMSCPVQCGLTLEELDGRDKYAVLSYIAMEHVLPEDGVLKEVAALAREADVSEDVIEETITQARLGTVDGLDILDGEIQKIARRRKKIARHCAGPLTLHGTANGQTYEVEVCTSTKAYTEDDPHDDVHLYRHFQP